MLVKGHVTVEADQAPFTNYDAGVLGANMSSPFEPMESLTCRSLMIPQ